MPLFSERVSMLEVQNRALKKTARERAERIDELERELQLRRELQQATSDGQEDIGGLQRELGRERQRAQHIDRLQGELQQMTRELERLKAERDFYSKRVAELEEHNRVVTEAATKYSLWGQKLFRELAALDPDGAPRRDFGTGSWM
jgi:chromosome segregation ATPase